MQNTTATVMLVLLMGACLVLVGCESDNAGSTSTYSIRDLEGTWSMVANGTLHDGSPGTNFGVVTFNRSGVGVDIGYADNFPPLNFDPLTVTGAGHVSGSTVSSSLTEHGRQNVTTELSGQFADRDTVALSYVFTYSASVGTHTGDGTLTLTRR